MNDKLRDALAIVEKYGMKGDVIYKEIEALAASKQEPQATTTNEHTERVELPSIDEMCSIIKRNYIEVDEHTDCAIVYRVTFDQLRNIYREGKAAAMLEAQPAEQEKGRDVAAFDVTIQDDAAKMLHTMVSPAFDGDEDCSPIRLLLGNGHSGYGLYVASADYPEEGSELLAQITTPPAQPARECVGLTDDERHPMIKRCAEYYGYSDVPLNMTAGAGFWFLTKDVESKLREKNAGLPAAVSDDIPAILKKQAS